MFSMKSLLHAGLTTTFMHLVLQMAAFALSQRLILIIIIESFSIDQGGGVMFIFQSEKTKKIKQFRLKDPMQSLNTRNE